MRRGEKHRRIAAANDDFAPDCLSVDEQFYFNSLFLSITGDNDSVGGAIQTRQLAQTIEWSNQQTIADLSELRAR
jgi:hypothetical protein